MPALTPWTLKKVNNNKSKRRQNYKYASILLVFNIHPLVLPFFASFLSVLLSLLVFLLQLLLELLHCFVDFLVDHLTLWVAVDVVLAEGVLAQLKSRVRQQVYRLWVIILAFVQLLQDVNTLLVFANLHEQLGALGHHFVLVFLLLL